MLNYSPFSSLISALGWDVVNMSRGSKDRVPCICNNKNRMSLIFSTPTNSYTSLYRLSETTSALLKDGSVCLCWVARHGAISHIWEEAIWGTHSFLLFWEEKKKEKESWREKEGEKSGQAEIADQIPYLNYVHHSECKLLLVKAWLPKKPTLPSSLD